MQDIRLRAGAAAFLSLAAFASVTGAVVVFIWWLVFSRPLQVIRKMRMVIPAIILVVFFGFVLELTGGGGVSYCVRMTVIILIGAWVYTGYRQGEFTRLGVWLLGKKTGFDFGMVAEMGLQSLELMVSDLSRSSKGPAGVSGVSYRPAASLSMAHSGGLMRPRNSWQYGVTTGGGVTARCLRLR
jgi:energy-coupling factor transport system permease protein